MLGCICVASISSGALGPFTPVDPLVFFKLVYLVMLLLWELFGIVVPSNIIICNCIV